MTGSAHVDEQAGIDPITLEVMWNRLIAVVNEQAAALMRTSFTTIVREAGDLSAGVFDARGNMIAQAVTGTPGHINAMATCIHHFLAIYPAPTPPPLPPHLPRPPPPPRRRPDHQQPAADLRPFPRPDGHHAGFLGRSV